MSKDINRDEMPVYTNLSVTLGDVNFVFSNISIDKLTTLDRDTLLDLMDISWYNYGVYDKIAVFGEQYTITKISKKNISMVRHN